MEWGSRWKESKSLRRLKIIKEEDLSKGLIHRQSTESECEWEKVNLAK